MSFDWNDISGHSSNKLKEQCKHLNIPIDNQATKSELVKKLQNYKVQMNLNKVKTSPLANNNQSSSAYSSRQASPIPSRMTPISTTKPSYLSSSRKNSSSSKHSSHKKVRNITPINKENKAPAPKNNFSSKITLLIILIIIFILCAMFI